MGAGCSSSAAAAVVKSTVDKGDEIEVEVPTKGRKPAEDSRAAPPLSAEGVNGNKTIVLGGNGTEIRGAGMAGSPGSYMSPGRGEWPPRLTEDIELGEPYPKGASGAVAYRCLVEGRPACAKVVQRSGAFPHHAAALENELRALQAAGRHPDLVEVIGVRDGDAELRVFYERCGQSLRELAPLPGREACRAALHVSRALSHLHATGVLHRDVNPSNVWRGPGGGGFCLGDLDVSKVSSPPGTLPRATSFTGTPNYTAPEVFTMGETPYGAEADVYSLGATAIHALSGKMPYEDLTLAQLEEAVGRGDEVPCAAPEGPEAEALLALARRCMSVDPAARPSAAEVALELGDVLIGAATPANTAEESV